MPVDPHQISFIYGTAWKEDRTAALTELAIRNGFRAIDTANQRRHYFEAGVGEALAKLYRAGFVTRADLFLQTKFTYAPGQDHRLPYDPAAPLATQVEQSITNSFEHLGTDYIDSYVLHGPASGLGWTEADAEVWTAMLSQRDAGRTRFLGVSNVSLRHLQQMTALFPDPPAFVQNRCFAHTVWDRDIRAFCRDHRIVYQGFSLLTANADILGFGDPDSLLTRTSARLRATPAQVIFGFACAIGILPLTGTSDARHMQQDLAALELKLSEEEIRGLEMVAVVR